MVPRLINPDKLIERKSCFLFGPRGTGKTYLIRHQKHDIHFYIDLLRSEIALRLKANPSILETMIDFDSFQKVVIDEIQREPILLNEVHRLIEEKGLRFLLTGSSARKLRKEHANMLGGRASIAHLFPLTWKELSDVKQFNLKRILQYGGLPRIYLSEDPQQELFDYIDSYLRDEIQAEALVRNLPVFNNFLRLAAVCSDQLINYSDIASDLGVSVNTVKEYFQILDDTLVGFRLEPWRRGKKLKTIATSKYFIFDIGVCRTLQSLADESSDQAGTPFEQFVTNEVRAYISYSRQRVGLAFWRTQGQAEVDLIIGDQMAIEIKSAKKVSERFLGGLVKINEEQPWKHRILVSNDPINAKHPSGILLLHWETFFRNLWDGEYI
jgi:predicted AAA+ superfamily ATPase